MGDVERLRELVAEISIVVSRVEDLVATLSARPRFTLITNCDHGAHLAQDVQAQVEVRGPSEQGEDL